MAKRAFVVLLIMLCSVLTMNSRASAHVLLRDDSGTLGALLHINPSDDPIAGSPATLYFDIQGNATTPHDHRAVLSVSSPGQPAEEISASVTGQTISAAYTFPARGLYSLELRASSLGDKGHQHVFRHTLRIDRGAAGEGLAKRQHVWAEILLLASIISAALLAISAFNNRREIANSSV